MIKPTLVIMAAGMGSRYGGLKQIEPVGPCGEIIMDYSVYDALKAGFGKVIFVIKKELENEFREKIGRNIESIVDTAYVFQDINNLPKGFTPPTGRTKPWGTGHAVLSCKEMVNTPFAVINADDFYGAESFKMLADYLNEEKNEESCFNYCLVGFELQNTLTENGYVSRGICGVDENGFLTDIIERTHIEKSDVGAVYTENGNIYHLDKQSIVSMNTWGFTTSIFEQLDYYFVQFLKENSNSLQTCEYYLPTVVDNMLKSGKACVKVLPSLQRWYGITYSEDKAAVKEAVSKMVEKSVYPRGLWK